MYGYGYYRRRPVGRAVVARVSRDGLVTVRVTAGSLNSAYGLLNMFVSKGAIGGRVESIARQFFAGAFNTGIVNQVRGAAVKDLRVYAWQLASSTLGGYGRYAVIENFSMTLGKPNTYIFFGWAR